MSICATVTTNNLIQAIPESPVDDLCPYVLVTGIEYQTTYAETSLLKVFTGFDSQNFGVGFGGVMLLFCVGLSVGMVVNIIRKGKSR